jgi:hypothetical protein
MEQSGEKDWKMWREKLNMLGVKEEKEGIGNKQYTQFNIFNIDRKEAQAFKEKFREYMLRDKE